MYKENKISLSHPQNNVEFFKQIFPGIVTLSGRVSSLHTTSCLLKTSLDFEKKSSLEIISGSDIESINSLYDFIFYKEVYGIFYYASGKNNLFSGHLNAPKRNQQQTERRSTQTNPKN